MRDKDVYPNLKIRTMNDSHVRSAHAVLEGFVISLDSPDIDQYIPPFDPNCRCWNEQSRDTATEQAPQWTPNPQWQGNPGRTGEIFNDQNSYNKAVETKAERREIRVQAEQAKAYIPYTKSIPVGKSKVYVNDFADQADVQANILAAKKIAAALDIDVYVRHHVDGGVVKGHKNPELGIGSEKATGDLKTYNPRVDDKDVPLFKFVENAITTLHKQNANWGVLDLSKYKGSESDFERTIQNKLYGKTKDMNRNVKHIIVLKNNRVAKISREQIQKQDFANFLKNLK